MSLDETRDIPTISTPEVGPYGCTSNAPTSHVVPARMWLVVSFALSAADDVIPEVDCVDADGEPLTTDQRGFLRDSMCDVGAFEVQP